MFQLARLDRLVDLTRVENLRHSRLRWKVQWPLVRPTCRRSGRRATLPTMVIRIAALATALCFTAANVAQAQELPPLPSTLLNASGAVCISISKEGDVRGAYILATTGDRQADRDMLAWVHQLHWPVATPGEKMRETWFPMPIGFGGKEPPKVPQSCSSPA